MSFIHISYLLAISFIRILPHSYFVLLHRSYSKNRATVAERESIESGARVWSFSTQAHLNILPV